MSPRAQMALAIVGYLAAVFFLFSATLWPVPARPHAAPSGWQYPSECCHDRDCREADPGEVEEVQGGYRVAPSATYLPHGDDRLRPSPDGRWHVCNQTPGDRTSPPLCVFVPNQGS